MEIERRSEHAFGKDEPRAAMASVDSLSEVATGIEAFLGRWVSRLEGLLDHYGNTSQHEAILERRIAQFDEEQRRWNEHRQQEMQQIQETAEQLSAAWERLEDEQRRVLQAREALQPDVRERDPAPSVKPVAAADPASRPSVVDATPAGNPMPGGATSTSREVAVRQFQQLRRQMGFIHAEPNGEIT